MGACANPTAHRHRILWAAGRSGGVFLSGNSQRNSQVAVLGSTGPEAPSGRAAATQGAASCKPPGPFERSWQNCRWQGGRLQFPLLPGHPQAGQTAGHNTDAIRPTSLGVSWRGLFAAAGPIAGGLMCSACLRRVACSPLHTPLPRPPCWCNHRHLRVCPRMSEAPSPALSRRRGVASLSEFANKREPGSGRATRL